VGRRPRHVARSGDLRRHDTPRTLEQLDDLLAGVEIVLSDEILDRIDAIVPPGTDVGQLDMAYNPPAVVKPALRRRPIDERPAA
jgi:aryl-alcohol dehydrogenase (NADP+)